MNEHALRELIQKDLDKAKKARLFTAILTGLLVVGLVIYMNWIFSKAGEMMQEDNLAAFLADQMEFHVIPESKPLMQDLLLNKVPPLMESAMQQAADQMPRLRQGVMASAEESLDALLADVELALDVRMRRELEASAPRVRQMLGDLETPEGRQALSEYLAGAFADEYSYTARNYMREFQTGLAAFDRELKVVLLSDDKDLTPGQWQRKRLFLLVYANLESLLHGEGGLALDQLRRMLDQVAAPVESMP